MQDGLRRMVQEQEDVFYYITVMNEKYVQPAMPKGVEQGIIRGLYPLQKAKPSRAKNKKSYRVQLMSSGAIMLEARAAAELLKNDFNVDADIWAATSFNELRRDALDVQHWNLHHPADPAKMAYVSECLLPTEGPIIAITDYMKVYADQVREFLPGKNYLVLGTDGFGRSDTRTQLRSFFEVDRRYIAYTAIKGLVDAKEMPVKMAVEAMGKYGINPEKPNPVNV